MLCIMNMHFLLFLGGSCCCFSKWKTSRFPIISENSAGSFLLASWVAKSLLFFGGVGRDDRSSPKKPGPAWIKEVHWKIKNQQWNPSNRLPNLSINGTPLTVCLHLYHLLGLKKSRFFCHQTSASRIKSYDSQGFLVNRIHLVLLNFQSFCNGNLRVPPQCHPPKK